MASSTRRGPQGSFLCAESDEAGQQVIDMTRPAGGIFPGRGLMVELETDFETDLPDLAGKESECAKRSQI